MAARLALYHKVNRRDFGFLHCSVTTEEILRTLRSLWHSQAKVSPCFLVEHWIRSFQFLWSPLWPCFCRAAPLFPGNSEASLSAGKDMSIFSACFLYLWGFRRSVRIGAVQRVLLSSPYTLSPFSDAFWCSLQHGGSLECTQGAVWICEIHIHSCSSAVDTLTFHASAEICAACL